MLSPLACARDALLPPHTRRERPGGDTGYTPPPLVQSRDNVRPFPPATGPGQSGVVQELWYLPTVCLRSLQTSWLVMYLQDALIVLAITLQGRVQHPARAQSPLGLLRLQSLQGFAGSGPHSPSGGLGGGRLRAGGTKGAVQPRLHHSLPLGPEFHTGLGGIVALWSGRLVPNIRAAPSPGGSPQPFSSPTSLSSSLKMGAPRLTCLTGVRVN